MYITYEEMASNAKVGKCKQIGLFIRERFSLLDCGIFGWVIVV